MALRNSFKNFRRGCTKEKDQSVSSGPTTKRKRMESTDNEEEISESEYDEAVQTMKDEYKKKMAKKPYDLNEVKRLMNLTRQKRRAWIVSACPLLSEVTDRFPFLQSSSWVSLP